MNLLAGMEKFGFSNEGELDILKEEGEKQSTASDSATQAAPQKEEKDFVLTKKTKCPICDKEFPYRTLMVTKLKRLEPDFDLRPNYEYVDKIKYDFLSCPHCGYSSLDTTFDKIDSARIKLIRTEFCPSFKADKFEKLPEEYSYDYSVEKLKLALICSMKKRAKMSEKAYVCLKISWLRRSQLKELEMQKDVDPNLIKQVKAEQEGFYKQAYEGFMKAVSTETPPYCGMASEALEYMLANMSMHYKKYDVASKLIARLLQSPTTNKKIKDKCLNLKQEIVEQMKK